MEKKQSRDFSKGQNPVVINLQQGKIPPEALDLEEAVLGAMLIAARLTSARKYSN